MNLISDKAKRLTKFVDTRARQETNEIVDQDTRMVIHEMSTWELDTIPGHGGWGMYVRLDEAALQAIWKDYERNKPNAV